jgi:hypothetical protein
MIRTFAYTLGFLAVLTGTAMAAPFCTGDSSGLHLSFGVSVGGPYTDAERDSFDMMHLRQQGVDVTRVERWNGCIRAFVRQPGGGEEMQFFQPNSYERVY